LKVYDLARNGDIQLNVKNIFNDVVQSVAIDYIGNIFAFASKDRKITLVDPRSSQVVDENEGHQGPKGIRLTWLGNSSKFISTGFSKLSDREFKVWDSRSLKNGPVFTKQVELASGALTPFYDAGTGIVFFAGRGDTSITFWELEDTEAFALGSYPSGSPIVDVALLPKTQCDVTKVEIDRMLKLSTTTVEQITFTVPRNRLEFFQDDIFPPTPKFGQPLMSSSQWLSGSKTEPTLISLQPPGMQSLTDAPKIVREKKYKFDPTKPKEEVQDLKDAVINKFYTQMTDIHKDAEHTKSSVEVAEDEWGD